jgi:hypothetical protein
MNLFFNKEDQSLMQHAKLTRFMLIASILCTVIGLNCMLSQKAYAASNIATAKMSPSLAVKTKTIGAVFNAHSIAGSGWVYAGAEDFNLLSADGKAQATGTMKWYQGKSPSGYLRRGEYSNYPVVAATRSVGCIWAQVTWGYPLGSLSFPPGASIQGAEKVNGFFVNCRTNGSPYPAVLSLGGLAYAKALLNSSTLTICTSATKREGPRYCGAKKMYYHLG